MAERASVKVGPSNRVVMPAQVRAALGVQEGDRVEFVIDGVDVHLVSPHVRLAAVWAKNHGGDGGDSTSDVREARLNDLAQQDAKWDRIEAAVRGDDRSEDEIAADLLARLGLD